MADAQYTGSLKRGNAPGTIIGVLVDRWGWEIYLLGTRNDSGGYTLTGTLGEPPAALRIEAIDGPAPKP
jgi:hypothetical protein